MVEEGPPIGNSARALRADLARPREAGGTGNPATGPPSVGFAPVARRIGASGACCTSTVVYTPVADAIGGSGA